MKKLDNYSSCLDVLRHADFEIAEENVRDMVEALIMPSC